MSAVSDLGLVRATNQDVARIDPELGALLVADGMGGHDDGAAASATAAEAWLRGYAEQGGPGDSLDAAVNAVLLAFGVANHAIASHPSSRERGTGGMGTTLVAATFAHDHVVVGNVGDSRCYRLRLGELTQLTQDHSVAAQMRQLSLDGGAISGEVAGRLEHVLTRCLDGNPMDADVRVHDCRPGDVYLLCSDGLWGNDPEGDRIRAVLQAAADAEAACKGLISMAWAGGGLDNIGVAVARVGGAEGG